MNAPGIKALIYVNHDDFNTWTHHREALRPIRSVVDYFHPIICLCQIILISSEKKSLYNNKYYVYISYKFYSTKGIIFALLLNYS